MQKIGIGVIGCGKHAWMGHFPWYDRSKKVEIVAVYSRTEAHAKKAAKRWGAKAWYTDYKDLLQSDDIDAVSICSPVNLHKEMVIAAAKANKHILCEKPMALSSKEAKEMIRAIQKAGVILMLGFCHRFYQPNIKVKNLIEKGKLGKLVRYANKFAGDINYEGTWFAQKEKAGGGVIMDNCIHSVDLFRWLIGEAEIVSAFMETSVQKMEVEDTAIISLRSQKGVLGVIESSWSTPFSPVTIEVYGSKGAAIVDYDRNELRYRLKGDSSWRIEKNRISYPEQAFGGEIDYFIDCIIKKKQPAVNGNDGLKSLRIMEAVYHSVEEKRCINVETRKPQ